jgi:hypothetical protein
VAAFYRPPKKRDGFIWGPEGLKSPGVDMTNVLELGWGPGPPLWGSQCKSLPALELGLAVCKQSPLPPFPVREEWRQ